MVSTGYLLLLLTPVALQLVGLSFAVWSDPFIRREHRRLMLIIVLLIVSLILQNLADYYLAAGIKPMERTIVSIYGYSVRPLVLLLFFYIVSERKHHWKGWVLVGCNLAVSLTALFSPICFSISESGRFHRGPLGYTCHIVSAILLLELVRLTFRKRAEKRGSNIWIPLVNAALIVGAVVLDTMGLDRNNPMAFLTAAMVSAVVYYYIWLHLQFVREHERDLMAEQRMQIMLSQIKPHFLYNALGTIEELCVSDPGTAKLATAKFSRYLRGNMDSLSAEGMIPFEKELEHTRLYLDLEQLRFEDALQVRYDIQCTDFSIPTLTLEPMVENAVRHGVRGKADGRGTVTVATREDPEAYAVTVTDDGPGFDPGQPPEDGKLHVGIANVRERLHSVCGGVLRIKTAPGQGTEVTILLPKKGEKTAC